MMAQTTQVNQSPVVFQREGEARTSSRDVAEFFDKRHSHVLDAVDSLVQQEPALVEGGQPSFRQTPYIEPTTGQSYRSYEMTRDGFVLLAMGFTGKKALKFKMAYIEAFNRIEAELRARPEADPVALLNDPAAMRGLLLGYSEKVLELEAKNAVLAPKAEALDRIATADGSLNVTEAAKALQMRPKDLFSYLSEHGWIYRRPGASGWLGYQSKVVTGLLEHKVTTVYRGDGSEKITEQVRVTSKGLTRLSALVGQSPQLVAA